MPSKEVYLDRLYMYILMHVFTAYLLLLVWCSIYLLVCICVYIGICLCCICIIHLSHTHTDVIVAFTYKWFYGLVYLLLYSFHVNYIRSFRVICLCNGKYSESVQRQTPKDCVFNLKNILSDI